VPFDRGANVFASRVDGQRRVEAHAHSAGSIRSR
jgi:hypothetical protein